MRWRVGLIVGLGVCLLLGGWRAGEAFSPVATPPMQDEQAAAALAAALRIFNGLSTPECVTPNAEGTACITLRSTPAHAARGIAHVGVAGADGVGGTNAMLGRDLAGEWRLWFTTQNFYYQLLWLPGEMMVCAEGAGANVRAEPSTDAPVLGALPDLTRVMTEEFVLTEEQERGPDGSVRRAGAGWYRLSAPAEGWTYSRLLSNTRTDAAHGQADCWARDVREGMSREHGGGQ